jgi:hypothetical protein
VLALIAYKHAKHVSWKELIDPRSQMIPTTQWWDKITKELQKKTKTKNPRSGTMCKDKWNAFNFKYKKLADYHKGIGNHTNLWELFFEEKERFHLPFHFN